MSDLSKKIKADVLRSLNSRLNKFSGDSDDGEEKSGDESGADDTEEVKTQPQTSQADPEVESDSDDSSDDDEDDVLVQPAAKPAVVSQQVKPAVASTATPAVAGQTAKPFGVRPIHGRHRVRKAAQIAAASAAAKAATATTSASTSVTPSGPAGPAAATPAAGPFAPSIKPAAPAAAAKPATGKPAAPNIAGMRKRFLHGRFPRGPNSTPSVIKPHFHLQKKTASPDASKSSNVSSPTGYTPAQILAAYGLNKLALNGAGSTVAIVDAYVSPTLLADFQFFDSYYKLGNPGALTIHQMKAGTAANSGWALEQNTDVQCIHFVAPQANIIMVQAASDSTADLLAAEAYAATVGDIVSNSWGGSEWSTEAAYNSYFSTAGKCFLASAGDATGTNWPSVCPTVLSIGGTSLQINGTTRVSETAWADGGGGVSSYIPLPTYQSSLGGSKRETPDVALSADPDYSLSIYTSYGYEGTTGWIQIGGTSVSCALWAGIIALLNQQRVSLGKAKITTSQLQNYIYAMNSSVYASDFYDITTGASGANKAKVGYDLVTGLGSCDCNPQVVAAPVSPTILTGSGAPAAGSGSSGNYYVNLSTGQYYLNTSGTWALLGSIVPASTSTGGGTGFIGDVAANA